VPRLSRLIELSQTAAYWLYDPDGGIHVVPARLIEALRLGSFDPPIGTITVSRSRLKSMFIALDQFMIDLLTGVWLGTSTERAFTAADGNDEHYAADATFEIKVVRQTLDVR
jgi:hypothetical protein